ncbi:AAA family ATPase [Lonepinella sp. BR2271]|uniref:AAA family ATPase n=1 Tax=Lonepinella sp. BR2271 TaxID=3434550 RepID=UPI003F6DD716
MLFQEFNIPQFAQRKIKERYGLSAYEKIKRNPYQLANIRGIGFKMADDIGLRFGIEDLAFERVIASMDAFYRLKTEQSGDTSINCREFLDEWMADITFPSIPLGQEKEKKMLLAAVMVNEFSKTGKDARFMQFPRLDVNHQPMIDENGKPILCFSSARDISVDLNILDHLRRIYKHARAFNEQQITKLKPLIEKVENANGRQITLDNSQINAVYTVLRSRISCLTGGAGCGKTTILKRIIDCVSSLGLRVVLCSPTGKAAKRMSESTGRNAMTIHSLIHYKSKGDVIAENYKAVETNEVTSDFIKADWVFVDESSMIDADLARALLAKVQNGTRITFIGDPNQLPPVSKGCFFYDIIDSNKIPVAKLTTVHRQANGNDINDVAHLILGGSPRSLELGSRKNIIYHSFDHLKNTTQGGSYESREISEIIQKQIVSKFATLAKEHGVNDVMLITAKRQTSALSSDVLNVRIRQALYPNAGTVPYRCFLKGERIMGIKNVRRQDDDLDDTILNGEMGTVILDDQKEKLMVRIDGETGVRNLNGIREHLTLGYAMTVHKSQGSEAKYVLTTVTSGDYVLLNREWFYTNVTRGKQEVHIYGQAPAINRAVKHTQSRRNTLLRHFLNDLKPIKSEMTENLTTQIAKLRKIELFN